MTLTNDVVAAAIFALVVPAILFVTALFVRQVLPPGAPPARTADRIVRWYAAHPQLALWGLLFFLPLSSFVLGLAALLRTWGENPQFEYWAWRALQAIPRHWPAMSIGAATLVAMAVLVMITAHIMHGISGGLRSPSDPGPRQPVR
jgi:hypothetical protein